MPRKILTQKELKKLLHYDPDSGLFTWNDTGKGRRAGRIAGSNHSGGYIRITINYHEYFAHRLACLYMNGELPPDQTDHADHDRSNNRWANISPVSHAENSKNKKFSVKNKSGICGVRWHEPVKKWHVQILSCGKKTHGGYFDDIFEAVCCRKSLENKLNFHANHGEK